MSRAALYRNPQDPIWRVTDPLKSLSAAEATCLCNYPVAEGWDHSTWRAGMGNA